MGVCGISPENQRNLLQILGGILHLGNVDFRARGNESEVIDMDCKQVTRSCHLVLTMQLRSSVPCISARHR